MARISFQAEPSGPGESRIDPLSLREALTPFGELKSCVPLRVGRVKVTSSGTVLIKPTTNSSWTSKGNIFSSELIGCPVKELQNELWEKVAECTALRIRGRAVHSERFMLTFVGLVPEEFRLNCFLLFAVRPHTPAPLRCFNYFAYTHHGDTCTPEKRICPNCSLAFHGDVCEAPRSVQQALSPSDVFRVPSMEESSILGV